MNFKKTCMFLLAVLAMAVLSVAAPENIEAKCPKKVAVVLETVKAAVFLEYQFSGQGQAEIVAIKSPVSGVISEIKVSEGSLVDAGQDLVVMNAGMSEEIKKLAAEAAKAKKILTDRQNWKVKSEKAVQAAEKDYQKALDLLNEKKAQTNQVVKAPLAGIVHLIMAAGSETAADALLMEIANPRQIVFQISLTASDSGLLTVGDKFFGTTEGVSGEVAAEVVAVSKDQATFMVKNNENQVKEGVTFTFKKLEAEHAAAIVIPTSVVQHDNLGDFIFVVEKNKAKKLYVTLGVSRAGKTMVLKGLVAETQLIISGIECLADGKSIRIVNQEELVKEKAAAQAKKEAAVLAKEKDEALAKEKAAAQAQKKAEALAKKEAKAQAKIEAEKLAKEKAEELAKLKEQEATLKEKKVVEPALETETMVAVKKTACPKKVAVVLETVKAAVFLEYQFSGQGQAEIVAIKSPVSGVISEIKVSEGSLVDAGQDLIVMNAGMNEEIKKLAAEAAKAKKILTVRQNATVKSEKAIQAAEKDYQKVLDLLNEKKAQANQVVQAPVAGTVHLIVAVGSVTTADAPLLEIANPKQMVFQISLTPADKGLVAVGDKFFGTTEGFSGKVVAEVIVVSNDQATFRVNNNENQVKEGVTFTFIKPEAEHVDAIIIPTSAVQHDNLGDFVYAAENNKAQKLYVILGTSRAGKTMVLKGLVADTPLIISGIECLANGKKIRIVNREELAKEKTAALAKLEEKIVTEPEVTAKESRFRVGLTFGRFTVNDKNLRVIYPNWFQNIPGIELSVHTLYNVDIWASGKIYSDENKTTYYGNDIKFKLVPLAVGLRYRLLKWRFLEPFVGAGLNFYSYSETISGESDLEDTKGKATGFHFQAGTYFHLNSVRFLLGEIFLKYNMVKKTLVDLLPDGTATLDLGGLEMGIGIVIKF